MKSKIITIANHKGGVGKTTTTASVGSILATKGYRVLLIDLDAQANLTSSLCKDDIDATIYDTLSSSNTPLPIIKVFQNLDIVPASIQLAQADLEFGGTMARERMLSDALHDYVVSYDFILIDCPPSLGLMTLNALAASDFILTPLVAETLPVNGLTMIVNFVDKVNAKLNPRLKTLGVLLTRFETTNLSQCIEQGLREKLGDLVFRTKIRKNVTLAQAPLQSVNIVEYDPKSNGAKDYLAFTDEFLDKIKEKI